MNQRTDPAAGDRRSLTAEWIWAFILGTVFYLAVDSSSFTILHPWIRVEGASINAALGSFAGRDGWASTPSPVEPALIWLLVTFVAAPTMFLIAWRKLLLGGRPQSFTATILFVLGGAVTLAAFIPSLQESFRREVRAASVREQRSVHGTRDRLMNGLDKIAVDAQSYFILSSERPGGTGSFSGYKLGPESGAGEKYEIVSNEGSLLRLRGSADVEPGSAVLLDVGGETQKFSYEGAFVP